MKKTKMICTIGPASEQKDVMRELIKTGMNVVRMNFSHGDYEEHGFRIKNCRELNEELGIYMSKKTDIAILLGKEQTKPIYNGLIKKKFKKENIYILNNVNEAFELVNKLVNKETYVLVQSDLPDIFNEK